MIERHGRPERNIHALQIEVDRRSYLDQYTQKARRRVRPRRSLDRWTFRELAEELLGRQFATAAE